MSAKRHLFDAHFHIIDPKFSLVANNGYLPPAFTAADYRDRAEPLGVCGGAVVSGSFQAFDQDYLADALRVLGPAYVGVTQLPADTPDETIVSLDQAGIRAVRFNLRRGGSEGLDNLERMARRVHDLAGWHVELYADAESLAPHLAMLKSLPRVVIDHLGLSEAGQSVLLDLAGHGAKVKATGFGRLDFDISAALKAIDVANPDALMFGTDMPSTRAPRPFETRDIDLIASAIGEDGLARVLHDNAVALYRPKRAA
ncbi:MAG: amidohydrolase family protein [Pseudomonadota bacterium]